MARYIRKMIFRRASAVARGLCRHERAAGFESPFDVPIIGFHALPRPVTLLPDLSRAVVWLCRGCHFKHRPRSRRRAGLGRTTLSLARRWNGFRHCFRFGVGVVTLETALIVIGEAVARLFSYLESYKPRRNTSELSDGNAPSIAGGVLRSGAAEVVRHIRTPGV